MRKTKSTELMAVLDVDLVAFLQYQQVPIAKISEEAGRIAFHFPASEVAEKQKELASGRARVCPVLWSGIIRQLHQNFLSPAAKAALRSRWDRGSKRG